MGRVEHGYNVRPDLCATNCEISPRQFLGKFYTDALVHDAKALDFLVDTIGEVSTCFTDSEWEAVGCETLVSRLSSF